MVNLNILTRACPVLLHVGNGEQRRAGIVSSDDRTDPCCVGVTCCLGGRCWRPECEAPEVVLEDHGDLLPLRRDCTAECLVSGTADLEVDTVAVEE
eukprot:1193336-Rhodomonas_salina.2